MKEIEFNNKLERLYERGYSRSEILKSFEKYFISNGEVRSFADLMAVETVRADFTNNNKYELPVIAGVDGEGKVVITDIASNTGTIIYGPSGLGKSWCFNSIAFQLAVQSYPGDVSMMIFDRKQSVINESISRLPHVIGVYSNEELFVDIVETVKREIERRKKVLDLAGEENWTYLRNKFKYDRCNKRKLPYLLIVVEELEYTLSALGERHL